MTEIESNNTEGIQLEIPLSSDSDRVSLLESGSDKKRELIQKYLSSADKEKVAYVNTYSPGKRTTKYFRLSHQFGRKKKHIHICGGSTTAKLAIYRAKKLQAMIDRGAELGEIIAQVRDFNSGKK